MEKMEKKLKSEQEYLVNQNDVHSRRLIYLQVDESKNHLKKFRKNIKRFGKNRGKN